MRYSYACVLAAVLLLIGVIPFLSGGTKVIFGEGSIIYHLLTDRFYNGDPTNDNFGLGEYRPGDLRFYQGGDWQGIIEKLPYLANLGVTAIQISPIHRNEWLFGGSASYHGYWVHDYWSPEPHFGTFEDLRELVDQASSSGIAVIFDAVPNHTADYLLPGKPSYRDPSKHPAPPFDNVEWYHHNGNITRWSDEYQIVNHDLFGLDDLAQEKPEVKRELNRVYRFLTENLGAAGFRVDAAKHVYRDENWSESYLASFQQAVGVPCYGEVWSTDAWYVALFQRWLWGLEDFPLYYAIIDVFAHGKSCQRLSEIFDQDKEYLNPNRLITFISNHDVGRFLYHARGDVERLKLALGFLFTVRGIPKIYYGDEQGYSGGPDPWCREVMGDWNEKSELYRYTKMLCELRLDHEALKSGKQLELLCEDEVYAYARLAPVEDVIIVLTTGKGKRVRVPLPKQIGLSDGDRLVNLFNPDEAVRVQNGAITVSLAKMEIKIFARGKPPTDEFSWLLALAITAGAIALLIWRLRSIVH